MTRKKQRGRRTRTFLYSFAGTLLVLIGLFVAVYLYQAPSYDTVHFPSILPDYSAKWASYVPSFAALMSVENFSMIHSANASLPADASLITFTEPRLRLNTSNIDFHLVVALDVPNSTIDVLFLNSAAYPLVSSRFGEQQTLNTLAFGNLTLFQVDAIGQSGATTGWLSLVDKDHALVFSEGSSEGREGVQDCLSVLQGNASSMITRTDVKELLYTVGGPNGHYSLAIQNFSGKVRTGNMTLISVDPSAGGNVRVTYSVKFQDSATALAQVSAVGSAYLNAHQFTVYDSCVTAVQVDPPSSLQDDYRLAE